ncbi:MAG: alpha-2-macroglobulin family protein [Parabacteroides sp.]
MKISAMIMSLLIACGTALSVVSGSERNLSSSSTPQMIRHLISQMKEEMERDEEILPDLIRQMNQHIQACEDTTGQAILHSMQAEMYQQYYQRNRWAIRQRTELAGYVPEDIREWTEELFESHIRTALKASLQPADRLQQQSIETYQALLDKEGDYTLRPTLYDWLIGRAIELQPDTCYYQQWETFRRNQPERDLWIVVRLAQLDYLHNHHWMATQEYEQTLKNLLTTYGKESFSQPVRVALAERWQRAGYIQPESARDSLWEAALSLCEEGIRLFPKEPATASLKNIQHALTQSTLRVEYPQQLYPGKALTLKITYRNASRLAIRVYPSLRQPEEAWKNLSKPKGKTRGKLLKEVLITTQDPARFQERDTVVTLPNDWPLGLYECVVTEQEKGISDSRCFSVSRLALLLRDGTDGRKEVLVADAESGEPQSGVTLLYYLPQKGTGQPYRAGEVLSGKDGLARFPLLRDLRCIRPVKGADSAAVWSPTYAAMPVQPDQGRPTEISLFTDRGVYRPGQRILFKGIAYIRQGIDPHICPDQSVEVILRNPQGEEVIRQTYQTDTFGSFQGEFLLPPGGLSGAYTLYTYHGETTVRVEEYKRPSFQLLLNPLETEASFGQPLTLSGRAETFSGVALTEGTVQWRIVRRPFWFRFGGYVPTDMEQVATGEAVLEANGSFHLQFTPEPRERADETPYRPVAESFEWVATLTDSKGETQENRYHFSVADVGLCLQIQSEARMECSRALCHISAQTINRQPVDVSGSYQLYRLQEDAAELVRQGDFDTRQPLAEDCFGNLSSGRYRLEVMALDHQGRKVSAQQELILYRMEDKRPPLFVDTWLVEEQTVCQPGDEARFVFGTSHTQAHVLYELFQADGQRIHAEWIRLDNENRQFRIPYLAHYSAGLVASFTFVRQGQWFHQTEEIRRKEPDRQLTLLPVTFRDRLTPGEEETWTFRIQDADSMAVSAQVLAAMYDASLDPFQPFQWWLPTAWKASLYHPNFTGGSAFGHFTSYASERIVYEQIPYRSPVGLDWQGLFASGSMWRLGAPANGLLMKSAARATFDSVEEVATEEDAVSMDRADQESVSSEPSLQIRKNLAETAFFYPCLRTDPDHGEVTFRFKMPESHTTWKLQLLAHTPDWKRGLYATTIITQKPLMVVPGLPRFLRQGDQVTLRSQVMNQSGEVAEGRVRLELFDPETEQPVVCLTKSQKPFRLEAGETTSVEWNVSVPSHCAWVGCRIVAESDQGSDGEQQLLPVLSDQVVVTESVPFYLTDTGRMCVQLPDLQSATPFRYTLELSQNPIWQAVQALPTLTEDTGENLISLFSRYYACCVAQSLAYANPHIREIIRQWEETGQTNRSRLEENEELKSMLLEETPWLLEAQDEREQQRRLSALFDENRLETMRTTLWQRLQAEQNADGGWSWFKGFPQSSLSITHYVLRGMMQLVQLNAVEFGETEKMMQLDALRFLDRTIAEQYQERIRQGVSRKDAPSNTTVDYLFVRSFYRDVPESGEVREAIRHYTDLAFRHWKSYDYYHKAEIGWLLFRNGRKEEAHTIWNWIRKTATDSAEQGLYWANNRQDNFFYSPIETHCLLMALGRVMEIPTDDLDRMKQWLLNQKRTQRWESVPATANAIYALLLTGSDWLGNPNTCQVTWGSQPVDLTQVTVGTGYVKQTRQPDPKSGDLSRLCVEKSGEAPAWGALYRQSFQSIREVKQQKGALQVEKQFFVEEKGAAGMQIRPLASGETCQVGDKLVIRLVIRSDRALDYVALKDLRAGCLEPAETRSGVASREGIWYYHSPKDASEQFFFDHLPKGTFVLEYAAYVTRPGTYAGGLCTLQCLYAPEFVAHTGSGRLVSF